jgi:hypothetical protein
MIWANYVVLAGSLVDHEFEASKRSAVSRAYYGAFNVARRWLEAHDMPIDNRGAHERVWRTFRAAHRATLETKEKWHMIGELGGELRALRNQVDYADVVPGLYGQAFDAVDTAERIIALLDELELVD